METYLSTAIKTIYYTFRLRLSFFRHRYISKKVEWILSTWPITSLF